MQMCILCTVLRWRHSVCRVTVGLILVLASRCCHNTTIGMFRSPWYTRQGLFTSVVKLIKEYIQDTEKVYIIYFCMQYTRFCINILWQGVISSAPAARQSHLVMVLHAIHTFYQLIVLLNQERNQDIYSIEIVYNILNQDIYKASCSFISLVISP